MSILMPGSDDDKDAVLEAESDVIVTAVILGFCVARAVQGEPFSFDVEAAATQKPEEYGPSLKKHQDIVKEIKRILEVNGIEGREVLSAGASESFGGGMWLITGRSGGAHMQPRDGPSGRSRGMQDRAAQAMAEWERLSSLPASQQTEVTHQLPQRDPLLGAQVGTVAVTNKPYERSPQQYHGRGAYTGMIDDPVGSHTMIQPTLRRQILDPHRWYPKHASRQVDIAGDNYATWGLILPKDKQGKPVLDNGVPINLSLDPTKGMGNLRHHDGIVQYTHGMSWAMREAVRWGPWCNAYELAAGEGTKKLASCFPCTTYMYAAGFPPSSCHIGRGESWAPLPDGKLKGPGEREDHKFSDGEEGEIERQIARSFNIRWHAEIYHYMRKGCQLLKETESLNLNREHKTAAEQLWRKVATVERTKLTKGGNLFLDAITWHKSESDRLASVFKIG